MESELLQGPVTPVFRPVVNDGNLIHVSCAVVENMSDFKYLTIDQVWSDLCSGKNHMYEVLQGEVMPYFDFDQSKIQTFEELNKIQNQFISEIVGLQTIFKNLEWNKNFFVMVSSGASVRKDYGPFKFSAHVVIRENGCYDCGKSMELDLCDKVDGVLKSFKCDRSVYKEAGRTQKMRMLYCYKKNKANVDSENDDKQRIFTLVGVEPNQMTIELYKKTLIQNVAGEHVHPNKADLAKTTKISFKDIMDEVKKLQEEENEIISDSFIEYAEGMSDDDCIDKMIALFCNWHPSAGCAIIKEKDNYSIISFRGTTSEECRICKRTHTSNNTFMTFHPENHVGYYKCHSEIGDGKKENKIKILGIKKKEIITKVGTFDKNDDYCWINFESYYSTNVFANFNLMLSEIKKDLPRVFARISAGNGMYVKKDNNGDKMFNMIDSMSRNMDFSIKYKEIIENKKKEKSEVVSCIKLSVLIHDFRNEFPVYSDVVCKPNIADAKNHEFNMWCGLKAQKVEKVDEALIAPILDLLLTVWANNDKETYDYLLKWFSNLICNPGEPCGVALSLFSGEGTGKNTLIDFLSAFVLGDELVFNTTGISSVTQKHNSGMRGKRLCVVNEMASTRDEFRSNFEKMKSCITDRKIRIEPKNVDSFEIDNLACWIMCSNNKDALTLSSDDRRYCCLEVSNCHQNDYDYFNNIRDKCFNQLVGNHFMTYLSEINAKKIDVLKIPTTKLKQEVIDISKPNYDKFLMYVKEEISIIVDENGNKFKDYLGNECENRFGIVGDYINSTMFYERYCKWCDSNGEKNKLSHTKFSTMISSYITKERKATGICFKLSSINIK